jgi:hypothetical protein
MDEEGRYYICFQVTPERTDPEAPRQTVYYYQRTKDVEPELRREYLRLARGQGIHGPTAIAIAERLDALYQGAGCWRFENRDDARRFLEGRGLAPGSCRRVDYLLDLVVPARRQSEYVDGYALP